MSFFQLIQLLVDLLWRFSRFLLCCYSGDRRNLQVRWFSAEECNYQHQSRERDALYVGFARREQNIAEYDCFYIPLHSIVSEDQLNPLCYLQQTLCSL